LRVTNFDNVCLHGVMNLHEDAIYYGSTL
jgi:hypothetical protein